MLLCGETPPSFEEDGVSEQPKHGALPMPTLAFASKQRGEFMVE